MHPKRTETESERNARAFVASAPSPSARYPTINLANPSGGFFGQPPARPDQQPNVQPTQYTPLPPVPPAPVPQAPMYQGVPAPVPVPQAPMYQSIPAPMLPAKFSSQAPPQMLPASYGQVPQQGQHVVQQHPTLSASKIRISTQPAPFEPTPPKIAPNQGQRPNKKALIIGCNYRGTAHELQGCIHDARNVEFMLHKHFGFQKENIRLLTDDNNEIAMPTRENIRYYIGWLVSNLQQGDSLFFHFSGHGSQKPDITGDERDGLNETLLPCDFDRSDNHQIVDDELNTWLINPLPKGVYLHAVIDACHSGTALDLEFYTKLRNGSIEWRSEGPTIRYKGSSGGIAVLFSACLDSQVAQDTDNLSGSVHTGAATHSFIEAIEKSGPNISYANVLAHMLGNMEELAKKSGRNNGPAGEIFNKLTAALIPALNTHQTPQISSNIRLNLNENIHL